MNRSDISVRSPRSKVVAGQFPPTRRLAELRWISEFVSGIHEIYDLPSSQSTSSLYFFAFISTRSNARGRRSLAPGSRLQRVAMISSLAAYIHRLYLGRAPRNAGGAVLWKVFEVNVRTLAEYYATQPLTLAFWV